MYSVLQIYSTLPNQVLKAAEINS